MAQYYWQDSDSWRNELLRQKQNQELLSKLPQKEYPDLSDNPDADSFWSTGRNCPQCSAQLVIKELREESGTLVVNCSNCGKEYHHQDLENPNNDALFRQIPLDMILRYVQDMERKGR